MDFQAGILYIENLNKKQCRRHMIRADGIVFSQNYRIFVIQTNQDRSIK